MVFRLDLPFQLYCPFYFLHVFATILSEPFVDGRLTLDLLVIVFLDQFVFKF